MREPAGHLTLLQIYMLCVLGILISIVLPILRSMLPVPPRLAEGISRWQIVKPYLMALAGDSVKTWGWQNAILAGYAWDSTLQKIGRP